MDGVLTDGHGEEEESWGSCNYMASSAGKICKTLHSLEELRRSPSCSPLICVELKVQGLLQPAWQLCGPPPACGWPLVEMTYSRTGALAHFAGNQHLEQTSRGVTAAACFMAMQSLEPTGLIASWQSSFAVFTSGRVLPINGLELSTNSIFS